VIKLKIFLFLGLIVVIALGAKPVLGASLAQSLSGRILLSVEQNGEAWYVNPVNLERYFLGRPDDAFSIMRQLGLGISQVNFQKLSDGSVLARTLSGRIVLQIESHGEAWYINPVNLKKYYLGRPSDAFSIMRQLGLGITLRNLALITRANSSTVSQYSSHTTKSIVTASGTFNALIVTIDLSNPKLKIKTLTASLINCQTNCPAKPLVDYYEEGRGFAAINGSYFDTSIAKKNYYFFPVYNSLHSVFINEDQLKYPTTGPLIAFDTFNKFYYFKDSRDFKSVANFESNFGMLQAAIGNKPRLIENGIKQLVVADLDPGERDVKKTRNAIAYKDNKIYLVVLYSATVPNLADALLSLGVDYALNLDSGGSSALLYDGEYLVGPGRDIPNAIVFSEE